MRARRELGTNLGGSNVVNWTLMSCTYHTLSQASRDENEYYLVTQSLAVAQETVQPPSLREPVSLAASVIFSPHSRPPYLARFCVLCPGISLPLSKIYRKVTSRVPPSALDRVQNVRAREFIRVCLSPDPDKRPSAMELLDQPFLKDKNEDEVGYWSYFLRSQNQMHLPTDDMASPRFALWT